MNASTPGNASKRTPGVLDGRAAAAWVEEQVHSTLAQSADAPAALAQTLGRALGGLRAAALVDGAHAMAALDTLRRAVHRGTPFVLYLVATAPDTQGATDGSGHDSLHALAQAGGIVLVARNVQEVVDLGLTARRLCESLLVPVVVAMDREQTAESLQSIQYTDRARIDALVGEATDVVHCDSFEEKTIFGEQRLRLPRWFDVDRPLQWGARQTGTVWGRGVAAHQAYLQGRIAGELPRHLQEASDILERDLSALSQWNVAGAETLLVLMGSAIETAESVVTQLGTRKVGILGVRCLHAAADAAMQHALGKAREVLVFERVSARDAGNAPLLQWVRTAVSQQEARSKPRVCSLWYGMGGLPLRSRDVAAVLRQERRARPPLSVVGIDFLRRSDYPKHQVLVDQLQRAHPELQTAGIRGADELPTDTITLAWVGPGVDLARHTATLLRAVSANALRGRPSRPSPAAPQVCLTRLSLCAADLRDPGDAARIDVLVVRASQLRGDLRWMRELAPNARVLVARDDTTPDVPLRLNAAAPTSMDVTWYETPSGDDAFLLGATTAVLRNTGVELPDAQRLCEVHHRNLVHDDAALQGSVSSAFEDGTHSVHPIPIPEANVPRPRAAIPAALRSSSRDDTWFDSLPRFHDQVDVLLQDGDPETLTPDPYLALGILPAATTALRDQAVSHDTLPVIDTRACSGCGLCWQFCPDGALQARVVVASELTGWAMSCARQAGQPADALQAISGKINRRVAQDVADAEAPLHAATLLRDAASSILESSGFAAERRQGVAQAIDTASAAIDPLPLVRCGTSLLSLCVDAGACKACGLCAAVCPEDAIGIETQSRQLLQDTRRNAALHATLPTPPVEAVQQLCDTAQVGPLAAVELQESAHAWLSAGDSAEPGSGARLAVRSVFAVASTLLAPRRSILVQQIQELQTALSERIHTMLSDALPAGDLDVLSSGLDSLREGAVELSALAARFEKATQRGKVDSTRLSLFVEAARRVADVRWRLEQGINGFGMAPFSMLCLDGAATRWACSFPDNPFRVPIVVATADDAASLAQGLVEAQTARHANLLQELRHARRALDRPNEAALDAVLQRSLAWRDLTEEEQATCPPLLIVADEDALTASQVGSLTQVLALRFPVRVVLLSGLGMRQGDAALTLLAQRQAYVAQTSFARASHFVRVVRSAFDASTGAWIRLHAPSPGAHGFAAERLLERAATAVRAHVLPLYDFDPQRAGVFGSRLDLHDDAADDDATDDSAADDGAAATATADAATDTAANLAEWALGEGRFAGHFTPLGDNDPAPLHLHDWLQLSATQQTGKTPFILQGNPQQRLRVDAALARATQDARDIWRILRELAGVDTPFTERVRQEADQEAHQVFEQQKSQLQAQHQAQLAAARSEVEEMLVQKLEKRLAVMAGAEELLAGGED